MPPSGAVAVPDATVFPAADGGRDDGRGPAGGLVDAAEHRLVQGHADRLGQALLDLGPEVDAAASSTTASGTGTMHAISSASSVIPAQASSVVCFRPVSPCHPVGLRQGAQHGHGGQLGAHVHAAQQRSAADSAAVALMTSETTCSGMSGSASVRG